METIFETGQIVRLDCSLAQEDSPQVRRRAPRKSKLDRLIEKYEGTRMHG